MSEQEIFGTRLRAARKLTKFTQEELGRAAGFDEAVANARMNQYERSKHLPHYTVACRLGDVLKLDPAYFYARSNETAELLQLWAAIPSRKRKQLLEVIRLEA
jgi:transcriptional regulator with XRE-family HTH domain